MLENSQIRLRKVEPTDLPWLYRWENDATQWAEGDTHNPLSQKDLRDYIEQSTADIYYDRQLRLIIQTNSEPPQTIGIIDLYNFDIHQSRAAVGIYIDQSLRGKGYGKQAISLMQEYAFGFLRIRMLYALVKENNLRSKNVAKWRDKSMERVRILPQYSCHTCGGEINTWDWRLTLVLGFDHPHCEICIAKEYEQTTDEVRATVREYFGMEPCQGI